MTSPVLPGDPLLVPGRTCASKAFASRLRVLVDGEEYFRTLAQTFARAERQIHLSGWDLDPATELWKGDPPEPWASSLDRVPSPRFGEHLDDLVARRPGLRAHLLAWDFGTVFAVKRYLAPVYHLDWTSHWRVQVRLDGAHPLGSCLHVKAVSVDDTVAFVGGMDVSRYRWDRPGHEPVDPLRTDPRGRPSPPWHDQQLMVEGPAARMVADWQRRRWALATGKVLAPVAEGSSRWPPGLGPHLRDVEVALLRTEPAWADEGESREIEAAYMAVIAAARRVIYLENQYITSMRIAAALARRLEEEDGPEVIILSSQRSSGILEQATMDVLRGDFLRLLRQADRHHRLRVLAPFASADQYIKIHSKVALVDDWYLSCGSANLASRSLGLDIELDLALEARGPAEEATRAFIPAHRERLLAEFLGCSADDVRAAIAAHHGRLGPAIDALDPEGARLRPLEVPPGASRLVSLGDPEEPFDLHRGWQALPEGLPRSLLARALRLLAGASVLLALHASWRGPSGWLGGQAVGHEAPLLGLLALLLFGFLPLPMGALLVLLGFGLDFDQALSLALVGGTASAALGWLAGRLLGPQVLRAIPVPRRNGVATRLRRSVALGTAEMRLLPRYTWAEVNLVAGASGANPRDFLVGTVLGLLPGALILVTAGAQIGAGLRHPGPVQLPLAVLFSLLLLAAMAWLWKRQELLRPED